VLYLDEDAIHRTYVLDPAGTRHGHIDSTSWLQLKVVPIECDPGVSLDDKTLFSTLGMTLVAQALPRMHDDALDLGPLCIVEHHVVAPGALVTVAAHLPIMPVSTRGVSFLSIDHMARLSDDRRELVRRGYDQAGARYHAARPVNGPDAALLVDLHHRLQPGARVLDAGCGAGVPVARSLSDLGHQAVGLDLSIIQLVLAREHVVHFPIVAAEMSVLPVGSSTFDALVSYYAIIHVPREDHAVLFDEFRRVIRPEGWALVCLGSSDNPEDHDSDSWLGTPICTGATLTPRRRLHSSLELDSVLRNPGRSQIQWNMGVIASF
jgi:SAM-dependent methyltransferase